MLNVTIIRCDNGFIVEAGCMRLAFSNRTELAVELTRWLENPAKVEQEYTDKYRGPADAQAGRGVLDMVDDGRNVRIRDYGRGAGIALPTDTPTRERLRGDADGGDGPSNLRG